MITWEQDFMSRRQALCIDGVPKLWVRENWDTGRQAFEVQDETGNRIGGLDPSENAAKIRAAKVLEARWPSKGL